MESFKKIGLAAFATFLVACAEEPNRFPRITPTGTTEQGSSMAGAAEHAGRAAYAWLGTAGTSIFTVAILLGLPFLIFILVPRFVAGDSEELMEGLLIAAAGLTGVILTMSPVISPWFGAWIGAGIAVMIMGRGFSKWILFILFDIVLVIWIMLRLDDWVSSWPWWLKLGMLLVFIFGYASASIRNKSAASH
jgi:hypothetical protein